MAHQSQCTVFRGKQQQQGFSVFPRYSLCYQSVLMQNRGNVSEQTNVERTEGWPRGKGNFSNSYFTFKKEPVYSIQGWMEITTSMMFFLPFSFFHAFSFSLLSLSFSAAVTLCLSFPRSPSVTGSLCPIVLQRFDCYLQVSDACRATAPSNRRMIVEG